MMEYNDNQRAIIRRMSEISVRLDAALEDDRLASANMRMTLINFSTELAAVMTRSNVIHALARDHGDAFREFLDTL